jgi:hypothetical protein
MVFSWTKVQQIALKDKINRAKIQAKAGHPDFKMIHANECREANQDKYTDLTVRITKEHKLAIERTLTRRAKINA